MRKIIAAFSAMLISAAVCLPVLAHPNSVVSIFDNNGNSDVGSEEIGWRINETFHLNTTAITFKIDDTTNGGFTSSQKTAIKNGFAKWNNSPLSVTESSTASGTIVNDPNMDPNLFCQIIGTPNSYGHVSSWTMKLNTTYSITQKKVARELGHVIGLRIQNSQ